MKLTCAGMRGNDGAAFVEGEFQFDRITIVQPDDSRGVLIAGMNHHEHFAGVAEPVKIL
jgi:hypothetical protein